MGKGFVFRVKFTGVPKAYEIPTTVVWKLQSLNYIRVSWLTTSFYFSASFFLEVIFTYHFIATANIKLYYTI